MKELKQKEAYFPLFVNLKDKIAVVVGGGMVAGRRIRTLSDFDCRIHLIAPKLDKEVEKQIACYNKEKERIVWKKRKYQSGDCKGAFLAVAATNDRAVNQLIGAECRKDEIFVSVADCKEESDFYFPGIAKKDALVIGITASGTDHKLAARVTKKIKTMIVKDIDTAQEAKTE